VFENILGPLPLPNIFRKNSSVSGKISLRGPPNGRGPKFFISPPPPPPPNQKPLGTALLNNIILFLKAWVYYYFSKISIRTNVPNWQVCRVPLTTRTRVETSKGGFPVLARSSSQLAASDAWALSSNHNAKQLILIRCKHSQRAARSFVRGLEI
jgi:hypothetical protein